MNYGDLRKIFSAHDAPTSEMATDPGEAEEIMCALILEANKGYLSTEEVPSAVQEKYERLRGLLLEGSRYHSCVPKKKSEGSLGVNPE